MKRIKKVRRIQWILFIVCLLIWANIMPEKVDTTAWIEFVIAGVFFWLWSNYIIVHYYKNKKTSEWFREL